MAAHTQNSPRISKHVERQAVLTCNLCGSTERKPFCPENDRGLVQCQNCSLVFVNEQPDAEELYTLYDASYFNNEESGEVGYTDYIQDETNIRLTASKRLDHLEQFIDSGTMLDVGCAMGFFMDEAAKRGWQVTGLDVSEFATEYVQERFGHTAYHGSLLDVELPEAPLDMVTMYDVIEHVPDPMGYIERVAEILRPGGVFELATPDIHSLPARLTGKRWIGYKLSEEHVYYFSEATLRTMLERAGFEVLHTRHIGKHVTLRLFLDRLGFYAPWLSRPLSWLEKAFRLSERSFYVNPFDIIAVTARRK